MASRVLTASDPGLRAPLPVPKTPERVRLSRDAREAAGAGLGVLVPARSPMPMKRAALEPAIGPRVLRAAFDRAIDKIRAVIGRRAY